MKELAKSFAPDELVVIAWTNDPAPRHRSDERLADALDAKSRGPFYVIDNRLLVDTLEG